MNKPKEDGLPGVEKAGDDLAVFKVTKLDGRKNESTYECASIGDLRFKLAVEFSTLSPCIILYTKKEQLEVRDDAMELIKLGPQPIGLYFLQSEEDVIPYLVEDWSAEEWLKMLEHHESQGHAGAVERLKPWAQGNPVMKTKMEEAYRDMIRTKEEESENRRRIDIMARLCMNASVRRPKKRGCCAQRTMFHRALELGQDDVVRAFVAAGIDVNCVTAARYTPPLVIAMCRWRLGLIELLLSHGADVSARDSLGRTALHFAVNIASGKHSYPDAERIIRNLLRSGFNVNTAQDLYGDTPLHRAAARNRTDFCTVLFEHGADVNVRNNRHQRPIDLATDAATKRVLRSYEMKIQ